MAWYDVLAGVGQGLGQTVQDYQQRLLLERERQDRLAREEEERRRFQLGEARAAASEQRAGEQFALTKQQLLDQDVERVLQTFEGEVIPEDVVQWAGRTSPNVTKAWVEKGDKGYTRRLSAAERETAEQRRFTQRKRQVEEPLLAEQERLLRTPDANALSAADRKQLARLRGLSEDALLTPKERIEEAKSSQNYLVTQLAAQLAAARQNVVTPEQQRLLNAQVDQLNKENARIARDEEREFQNAWKEQLEAEYGLPGVKNSGRVGWERRLRMLTPDGQQKARLDFINSVRASLGYPPTTSPLFRLNPEVQRYERPYPTIGGRGIGVTVNPQNPLAGYTGPAAPGTTMTLPDGTVVAVSK